MGRNFRICSVNVEDAMEILIGWNCGIVFMLIIQMRFKVKLNFRIVKDSEKRSIGRHVRICSFNVEDAEKRSNLIEFSNSFRPPTLDNSSECCCSLLKRFCDDEPPPRYSSRRARSLHGYTSSDHSRTPPAWLTHLCRHGLSNICGVLRLSQSSCHK